MIVVINSTGALVSQQNENLFQGSSRANVIDVIAPFASNVTLRANFEMPDGTLRPENNEGYILKKSIQIVDNLNVWRLPIEFPITENYGIVKMQLRAMVGNQVICTTEIKMSVQKGVPYATEYIEPNTYDAIMQMIADLKALLSNKVDIIKYSYKVASNVNKYTVGTYYVYDTENDTYNQVHLPEDYTNNTTYYSIKTTNKIVSNSDGIKLEYTNENDTLKMQIDSEKVTINGVKVVSFDDLKSENIEYNNNVSGLKSKKVKDALDELAFSINNINNNEVVDLGDCILYSDMWTEEYDGLSDTLYTYKIKNDAFVNSAKQTLIITPNNKAINDLNDADIMMYPEVDIYQESNGVAVGKIKVTKQPNFNITVNIKLQGVSVTSNSKDIQAGQIVFSTTEDIQAENVQDAIETVQNNINTFKNTYEEEKQTFASLDTSGKILSSQLPSYVDDIIEGYLHNSNFYEDDEYLNIIEPEQGKIYVDLTTNYTYRWSGSQYSIVSTGPEEINNIKNDINTISEDIENIKNGTEGIGNASNADKLNNIQTLNNRTLVIGDTVIPYKRLLWTGEARSVYNSDISGQKAITDTNIIEPSSLLYSKFIIEGVFEGRNGGTNGAILTNAIFETPIICNVLDSENLYVTHGGTCKLNLYGNIGADASVHEFDITLMFVRSSTNNFEITIKSDATNQADNYYTFKITKIYEVIG